ncbi:MAG: hypothetical protein QMC95_06140 [Desulfitobacteriaceae bacterium]|nr:hypothetical protein [Desulfitobacteriaceae bacterium]MDI6913784.1 hypothetical protein [Desulfitobacteriaceae bacterium]
MSIRIEMPKLAATMEEGIISCWHKQVGDQVAKGEPIVEVLTGKMRKWNLRQRESWSRS